jgi:hypothetical protein
MMMTLKFNKENNMENILEAIEMHNEHVDKMQELAEVLLKTYPDVENTPVNNVFCEACNGIVGMSIWLCCEMNSIDVGKWMTDENWHVVEG